jgi:hypothetical protein
MLLGHAIGTKRLDRSGDIPSMSESEVLAKLGVPPVDGAGNPIDEFDKLEHFAEGSYGFVADIPPDESGKPRLIKIEKDPEIVDLTAKHGHRSRDVSAAYLRGPDGVLNVPGMIAPTHLTGGGGEGVLRHPLLVYPGRSGAPRRGAASHQGRYSVSRIISLGNKPCSKTW